MIDAIISYNENILKYYFLSVSFKRLYQVLSTGTITSLTFGGTITISSKIQKWGAFLETKSKPKKILIFYREIIKRLFSFNQSKLIKSLKKELSVNMSIPVAKAVPYSSEMAAPAVVAVSADPAAAYERGREFLRGHGWASGMIEEMIRSIQCMPHRFFILDDSGSMSSFDGKRKPREGNKMVQCSRWDELTASMEFHSEFAAAASTTCEFRLLNRGDPIVIGDQEDNSRSLAEFKSVMARGPNGGTPLCAHIRAVVERITAMAPQLRARNQKVSLTIATDGQATDGDIVEAMRPLKNLPVWTVIRLCTVDDAIVSYWNKIDEDLELGLDVLGDLVGVAKEVTDHNPWLTYGEALHRMREFGTERKELDRLNKAQLNPGEVRAVLAIILGGAVSDYPDPMCDYRAFINKVKIENEGQSKVWCPQQQRDCDCVDTRKLDMLFRKSKCTIM